MSRRETPMQEHAGGYVAVPGGLQARRWDEGADLSLRGIGLLLAATLALIGAFSALSLTSPGDAVGRSTPHAAVVGERVDPPKPTGRTPPSR
jgi:hypothetical protein